MKRKPKKLGYVPGDFIPDTGEVVNQGDYYPETTEVDNTGGGTQTGGGDTDVNPTDPLPETTKAINWPLLIAVAIGLYLVTKK